MGLLDFLQTPNENIPADFAEPISNPVESNLDQTQPGEPADVESTATPAAQAANVETENIAETLPDSALSPTATAQALPGSAQAPLHTVDEAADAFTSNQTPVGSNAAQVVWANANRLAITLFNYGANVMFIGPTPGAANPNTGFPIPSGGQITMAMGGAVFAISPSDTTLAVLEFTKR